MKISIEIDEANRIDSISRYNHNFYQCKVKNDVGDISEFVIKQICDENYDSYVYELGKLECGVFAGSGIMWESYEDYFAKRF